MAIEVEPKKAKELVKIIGKLDDAVNGVWYPHGAQPLVKFPAAVYDAVLKECERQNQPIGSFGWVNRYFWFGKVMVQSQPV